LENGIMPKVMVLFFGDEDSASVDAASAGARSVRFTEVEVRAGSATTTRHKPFDAERGFADVDGVLLVAGRNALDAEADRQLTKAFAQPTTANLVIGVVGIAGVIGASGADSALVDRATRSGGLLVTSTTPPSDDAAMEALGARVAKVAGWVRHALGHEAEHAHGHSHEHEPHTHAAAEPHSHDAVHQHGHHHDHQH
jgi:hypothetical protein